MKTHSTVNADAKCAKEADELAKLKRIVKAVRDSTRAIMRATDESDYLTEVCKILEEDCGHTMVWIGFVEQDDLKTVRPVAWAGLDEGYLSTLNASWADTPRGQGPTGRAVRTGKPCGCGDMRTDPCFTPWRADAIRRGYASSMVLPLMADGKAFGALTIYSKEPNRFAEDEVELLTGIAEDLAYGIAAIRLRAAHARAEEALRASQERFRLLVESAEDAIVGKTLDGVILNWNAGAEKIYGYAAEEIVGKPIALLSPAEKANEEELILARIKRGEHVEHFETMRQRKDGRRIQVSMTVSPIYDAEARIVAASAISRDITERKRVEETLRKLSSAVEQSPATVVITGPTGAIEYVNPKFVTLTGYTIAETLGQNPRILKSGVHPPEFYKAMWQTLASGEVWRGEICNKKKNGDLYWELAAIAPLRDTAGHVTSFVAIKEDITQQKWIEEQNQRLNEELRKQSVELTASNKELEAFAYSVSHDLRAPLRSIDGFSQALLEDYGPEFDEDGRDLLRRVRAAAQRMAALIDDLLGLSRVSRMEMDRQPVNLAELARNVAAELQAADADRRADFVIAPEVWAEGDARLLQIVMENLLGNAWKFTANKAGARIEFGVAEHEGKRNYFVCDNGAGFDMKFSDKLFQVFQRLHKTSEFPGTGVGLATVHRIVLRHGGRIWAHGETDRGATFFFTLP